MLAGQSATQVCFQLSAAVGGLLPADLDGTTTPPAGSPDYMLYYGTNSLNLYKFHVDFNTPANSTFTGPTVINVAAFNALCGGGICVPQPGTSNWLDSLADRLMFRLAYRNFGTHESLVVNHSVAVSGGGGVRWYEIQNPSGTPTVAQQGTFAPDSTYRWMGSVAMDQAGDIAVGYSKSSSTAYPSIAIAGRVPNDPSGTLEAETAVVSGTGSQTGTLTRWGDYSAMTVDPTDDCTFWYTTEYIKSNGTFNWNTRIVSFKFPACGSGGGSVTLTPNSLNFGNQTVGQPSPPQAVTLTNNQSVSLTINSITASGDYSQTNNCGSSLNPNSSCTINVVFTPTQTGTRTGTLTVNDNGPGSPQTASLTGVGMQGGTCVPGTLSNGGFETGDLSCWTTGGVYTPFATTLQKHGGSYSAQLGASSEPEPNGDSSIYQTVNVPSNITKATLTFWYWPATTDTIQYDWQEAQVRNTSGTMLAQIMKVCSNSHTWTQMTFDMTPYKGQSIQLYFNVHGDGYGDLTYMYLDDVNVTTSNDNTPPVVTVTSPQNNAQVSGTVTVSASATDPDDPVVASMQVFIDNTMVAQNTNLNTINYSWNTTTYSNGQHTIYAKAYDAAGNVGTSPTISVTVNNSSSQLLQNGGFETGNLTNWSAAGVYLPFVLTGHSHSGDYSAQLGSRLEPKPKGDSSLYQTIAIPSTVTSATLTFWYWPSTFDTIQHDWQEAQVQNSSGTMLAQIMKVCSNSHTWTQKTFDLTPYKGQTIRIYFNDHEDGVGDLTYMYLDDVSVVTK
jgi:Bacterial Ig domain/Transmembrane protein 131-like N-terminal